MSFNISLSGLNAAQRDLNTTSNNIANVNTIGFKESRAEFIDVYNNSLFSNSKTNVGAGVATSHIAQQFHQGALAATNNALDLAISGNGFFVTTSELGAQDYAYTRAGAFKLDDENRMVDSQGNYLMALPVNEDGSVQSVALSTATAVQIPQTAGQPQMSGEISMSMNLPSNEDPLDPALFDATDPDTYTSATSVTIYDSLGQPHIQTTYFVNTGEVNAAGDRQWIGFVVIDDKAVDMAEAGAWESPAGTPATAENDAGQVGFVLTFDKSGLFTGTNPTDLTTLPLGTTPALDPVIDGSGDGTQTISLSFDAPTQFASGFEVSSLAQDGATVGRLTNMEIGADGLILATYSNGTQQALGKVALANFANEQGLTQIGNTSWQQSQDSGEAVIGEPNVGTYGSIRSATLEQSNVDLTAELVDLISAQRNFQANSRALDVSNQLSQNLLQIG